MRKALMGMMVVAFAAACGGAGGGTGTGTGGTGTGGTGTGGTSTGSGTGTGATGTGGTGTGTGGRLAAVCSPCNTNDDCGPGAYCVTENDSGRNFCTNPCGANGTCASAANTCYALDEAQTITGCYPTSGSCVPKTCTDECTGGDTRCAGLGISTCSKGADGCFHWGSGSSCPSGKACSNGVCVSTCTDECSAGATRCIGSDVSVCARGADGCAHWGVSGACSGGQVCKVDACADCANSSDCDASSVCVSGRCTMASGRVYTITVYSGAVPPTNSSGTPWDVGSGPDPYVQVLVDGVVKGTTSTASDTLSASWYYSVDVLLTSSSVLAFSVYDEDIGTDELIDGNQYQPGGWIWIAKEFLGMSSGEIYPGSPTSLTVGVDPK